MALFLSPIYTQYEHISATKQPAEAGHRLRYKHDLSNIQTAIHQNRAWIA
jgi:hypothetical protein